MPGHPIKAGGAGPGIPVTRGRAVCTAGVIESRSGSVHKAPVSRALKNYFGVIVINSTTL